MRYFVPNYHVPPRVEDRCEVCGGRKHLNPHVDPRDPTVMHAPRLIVLLSEALAHSDAQADGAR